MKELTDKEQKEFLDLFARAKKSLEEMTPEEASRWADENDHLALAGSPEIMAKYIKADKKEA